MELRRFLIGILPIRNVGVARWARVWVGQRDEKGPSGAIPRRRVASWLVVERKVRFLVVRRGGLTGMTPTELVFASCRGRVGVDCDITAGTLAENFAAHHITKCGITDAVREG